MFKRILVPLDGSSLAEQALKPALALARRSGGQILLLRIPAFQQAIVPDPAGQALVWPEIDGENSRIEAADYLRNIQRINPQITMRTLVIDGDEASTIIDTAQEQDVNLIVMSTHGYSGFTRWMLGSVTEKVLRQAPCPVLVVRSANPITKVVIALDGSLLSEQALDPGLEVAHQLEAEVTLLRVYHGGSLREEERVQLDWTESGLNQRLHESVRESVRAYLEQTALHTKRPGQEIDYIVLDGAPAQTILDYIDVQGTDLVVMATHGRGGLRRWVYGSITEKVMRSANCSMLIIRPPAEDLA
ncbi:MAG: universal stress protein [Ardenticatenaceae bacterium]|nr:universal stress protein [Ardenticatenaceae bacterium]